MADEIVEASAEPKVIDIRLERDLEQEAACQKFALGGCTIRVYKTTPIYSDGSRSQRSLVTAVEGEPSMDSLSLAQENADKIIGMSKADVCRRYGI